MGHFLHLRRPSSLNSSIRLLLLKQRRLEKKKEDEAHLSLKSLIDDNNRLKASIAARLEQELGLPQSQTSSAPTPSTPPPSSVSVRASNTAPSHFQCDQCDFSSPSP